ncbi:MAG: hypothetical protein B7Y56_06565 [Gallionellales bacterium 35-53-114]|jgi:hypothetical protein|nr:MAG: hypothetical protein B7Y56_06565 [Gallionellales bacterium 35-53-114]OYZ64034.1 MAG: hypothetical protein B7Y04_07660 [Gallionellales bacterium 24-53-125]
MSGRKMLQACIAQQDVGAGKLRGDILHEWNADDVPIFWMRVLYYSGSLVECGENIRKCAGVEMSIKSEITAALQAHTAWRERFKDILNGRAPFDLNSIGAPEHCTLGIWLANEGQRMIPAGLYDEICTLHRDFHRIAAEVIQKIKDKRYAEANEDISLEGPLNLTSLKLRSLLVKASFNKPAASGVAPETVEQATGAQEMSDRLPPSAE